MKKYTKSIMLCSTFATTIIMQNAYADSKKPAEPPAEVYMSEKQEPSSPPDASAPAGLTGKVVETMNSGGYTYLCIEKDGQKTWVAILETKISVGQEVSVQPGYEMINFKSNTLNRTFDKIIFSTGLVTQDGVTTKGFHGSTSGGKSAGSTPAEKISVEKAAGANAYTVAELYEKRAELNNKNVVVKGKVVKVSSGIMGRNWLHIQDGTGNVDAGTHDIVVTTHEKSTVGDIVTASGTLYKDKDFGSGYKYDVIVEQASIKK